MNRGLLTTGLLVVALTGCGGAPHHAGASLSDSVAVITEWADSLRHGDEERAAKLFALPSKVSLLPGEPLRTLATREQVRAFQDLLPCGARLVSAARAGRYVNALFVLSDRPDSPCDAPAGATARTAFLISDGRIVEWRRAADRPGDGAQPLESQGPAV